MRVFILLSISVASCFAANDPSRLEQDQTFLQEGIEGKLAASLGEDVKMLQQGVNFATTIQPQLLEWVDKASSANLTSSEALWPTLKTGTFKLGLHKPQVYVISMPSYALRRKIFASQFAKLGLSVDSAQWLPGIDGSRIPKELKSGVAVSSGVLGCYLAHVLAIHRTLKNCGECDLVVFEDDVVFHRDFKQLWRKFMADLPKSVPSTWESTSPLVPVAHLHLGGDSFWAEPYRKGRSWWQANYVGRTWGYVLKGPHLKRILDYLLTQDFSHRDNMGIDQKLSGGIFNQMFATLTPSIPLMFGAGITSATENDAASENTGTRFVPDPFFCWFATYLPHIPCMADDWKHSKQ